MLQLQPDQFVADAIAQTGLDDFGGHSYREVATLLEQPEGTVKSRIRVGLRRLRDSLVDAGITSSWTES